MPNRLKVALTSDNVTKQDDNSDNIFVLEASRVRYVKLQSGEIIQKLVKKRFFSARLGLAKIWSSPCISACLSQKAPGAMDFLSYAFAATSRPSECACPSAPSVSSSYWSCAFTSIALVCVIGLPASAASSAWRRRQRLATAHRQHAVTVSHGAFAAMMRTFLMRKH